jgi:site-specific DNA recombinase
MKHEGKPTACRAALYARVSSDKQAQGGTIASQLALLQRRLLADGCAVEPGLAFVDDGFSGSTLVRPALERLRDQAAAGALDRLYVLAPDRLARRHAHQMVLVEELQGAGVEVVFVNRPLGTTPEDQLLLQVQGVIAEYERAKILERTRRGRLHAARCGRVSALGQAPYGYRYIDKHSGGGVAAYEVLEEEARYVRLMFAWVGREGCSLAEVARRLHQRGVRTRRGSARWNRATLWGMLTNPAYQGQAVFGKTRMGEWRPPRRPRRGAAAVPKHTASAYPQPASEHIRIAVPALVDADLFAAVQERLEHNRKHLRASRRGPGYLLQGLAVCGVCGYAVCAQACSRARSYYRCLGRDGYRFGGQRICDNPTQRTEDLEAVVWQDVCALLREPERLRQEFERRQRGSARDAAAGERARLRAALTKVKQGMSRLIDAYTEGLVEGAEFEPRMRRLKERLARGEAELQALTEQERQDHDLRLVFQRFDEFTDQIKAGLDTATWSQRREIVRALIKRVEVNREDLRIVYKVPARPFVNGPDGGLVQDCWRRQSPATAGRTRQSRPCPGPRAVAGNSVQARQGRAGYGKAQPSCGTACREDRCREG